MSRTGYMLVITERNLFTGDIDQLERVVATGPLEKAEARLNEAIHQGDIRWVANKTPLTLSEFIGRSEKDHLVEYYIRTDIYELAPYVLKKVVVQCSD